jgi:hypothetical protein
VTVTLKVLLWSCPCNLIYMMKGSDTLFELEGYNHTLSVVSGQGCHNSCKGHYVVLLYGAILSMHILWGIAEVSGE